MGGLVGKGTRGTMKCGYGGTRTLFWGVAQPLEAHLPRPTHSKKKGQRPGIRKACMLRSRARRAHFCSCSASQASLDRSRDPSADRSRGTLAGARQRPSRREAERLDLLRQAKSRERMVPSVCSVPPQSKQHSKCAPGLTTSTVQFKLTRFIDFDFHPKHFFLQNTHVAVILIFRSFDLSFDRLHCPGLLLGNPARHLIVFFGGAVRPLHSSFPVVKTLEPTRFFESQTQCLVCAFRGPYSYHPVTGVSTAVPAAAHDSLGK